MFESSVSHSIMLHCSGLASERASCNAAFLAFKKHGTSSVKSSFLKVVSPVTMCFTMPVFFYGCFYAVYEMPFTLVRDVDFYHDLHSVSTLLGIY